MSAQEVTEKQRRLLQACAATDIVRARSASIALGRRLVARGLLSEPWANSARPGCGVFFKITDAGRTALGAPQ